MLKKIYWGMAFIGIAAFLSVSCNKDEETDPTFKQSDFIGKWEVIGGDDFKECPDGDNKIFEITETHIKEGQVDANGCSNGSYAELKYTFKDGNSLDAGIGVYKIKEIKDSKMTLEMTSPLAPGQSATIKLEKK